MSLLQMIKSSGNVVTRRVSSTVYQWMLAISDSVDSIVSSSGSQAQTRYVRKDGNDTTGVGSFDAPFLTIARAITSITDATAAKPYTIQVAAGIYTEAFSLQPWMFVVGADGSGGTTISNPAANWIGAGFAGAGQLDTGIRNCFLGTAINVNFALVASPGAGRFFLTNCLYFGTAINATGNNILNHMLISNVMNTTTVSANTLCTIANILLTADAWDLRFGALTLSNTAAYSMQAILGTVNLSGVLTVSCASFTNNLLVTYLGGTTGGNASSSIVLTGDGVSLRGLGLVKRTVIPDANTTLDFQHFIVGATKGVDGGNNLMTIAATADRTIVLDTPQIYGTRLQIKNNSIFYITITYGTVSAEAPTYIPPNSYFNGWFDETGWEVDPIVQFGSVTLSNGVSALIPADIDTALGSTITATLRDFNGGVLGVMVCAKLAGRIAGTRAGGGGFVLTSITAAGVTVATDQGIYDWIVKRP